MVPSFMADLSSSYGDTVIYLDSGLLTA
jgi:hypothetical protein